MQYTFVENKEYQNGTQSSLCDDDNGDDIHSDGSRSVDNNPCINDDIHSDSNVPGGSIVIKDDDDSQQASGSSDFIRSGARVGSGPNRLQVTGRGKCCGVSMASITQHVQSVCWNSFTSLLEGRGGHHLDCGCDAHCTRPQRNQQLIVTQLMGSRFVSPVTNYPHTPKLLSRGPVFESP